MHPQTLHENLMYYTAAWSVCGAESIAHLPSARANHAFKTSLCREPAFCRPLSYVARWPASGAGQPTQALGRLPAHPSPPPSEPRCATEGRGGSVLRRSPALLRKGPLGGGPPLPPRALPCCAGATGCLSSLGAWLCCGGGAGDTSSLRASHCLRVSARLRARPLG